MWTSQSEGDQKPGLGAEDQLASLQRPDICQGEISWATILIRPDVEVIFFPQTKVISSCLIPGFGGPVPEDVRKVQEGREAFAHHELNTSFCWFVVCCPGALDWKSPTFVTYKRPLLQLMRLIVVTFAAEIRSERNHPKTRDQARTFQWSKLLSK